MAKPASIQVKEATGKSNPRGSTIPTPERKVVSDKVKGPRGRYVQVKKGGR